MSESNGSATEKPELDEDFARELVQAPVAARLRFEHAEKWVAWAPDEQSIIASGENFDEVWESARRSGLDRPLMEWVGPAYRQ